MSDVLDKNVETTSYRCEAADQVSDMLRITSKKKSKRIKI